jgi:16S rRNA (uracil1498-N3)-methyltransferase
MGRVWRVVHDAAELASGECIVLDVDQAYHIRRVLRLRAGDALRVFDGRGREWEAVLEADAGGEITVRLGPELSDAVEPAVAIELFQGTCRPEKLDWVVQKGTELGIAAIHLVATERSETRELPAGRLERWTRIAVESAKQCGRRVVPPLGTLLALPSPPQGVWACILIPTAESPPLALVLPGSATRNVWVACGPEGGFTPDEAQVAVGQGWIPVHLGPRILRAETAGLVAATILLHRLADLGS